MLSCLSSTHGTRSWVLMFRIAYIYKTIKPICKIFILRHGATAHPSHISQIVSEDQSAVDEKTVGIIELDICSAYYLNSAVSNDSSSIGATSGTLLQVLGSSIFTFLGREYHFRA
jgi:hypothetical protein